MLPSYNHSFRPIAATQHKKGTRQLRVPYNFSFVVLLQIILNFAGRAGQVSPGALPLPAAFFF